MRPTNIRASIKCTVTGRSVPTRDSRKRGCSKHPAFPAPSCLGETVCKPRAKRAAGMRRCVVIPGRAQREPGIHQAEEQVVKWIPGLRREAHPGMTKRREQKTPQTTPPLTLC
jgi:hypothetical protein